MGIWSMIFTAIIVLNTIGAIITVFKEKEMSLPPGPGC